MRAAILLVCCAGFVVGTAIIPGDHPASRVQRGTLAADVVAVAGQATVERPYAKRVGEQDVCDADAGVVKALEYVHPRGDGLRAMVYRAVVEQSSLVTICVDGFDRVTSVHSVQF